MRIERCYVGEEAGGQSDGRSGMEMERILAHEFAALLEDHI